MISEMKLYINTFIFISVFVLILSLQFIVIELDAKGTFLTLHSKPFYRMHYKSNAFLIFQKHFYLALFLNLYMHVNLSN